VIGARFGYDLLWLLIILTISLAVVQEMAARMGAATGRGLLDLVRERFGIGWALVAVGALLIGNGGVVATEFCGHRRGGGAPGRARLCGGASQRRAGVAVGVVRYVHVAERLFWS